MEFFKRKKAFKAKINANNTFTENTPIAAPRAPNALVVNTIAITLLITPPIEMRDTNFSFLFLF